MEADLTRTAASHPALRLLVLFGSRAAGTAHAHSDWDIGFLAEDNLDTALLAAELAGALGTDDVDLVDLAAASAVLRRDTASNGRPLFERTGEWLEFRIEAASFWCDVESVVRRAHADVLRTAAG